MPPYSSQSVFSGSAPIAARYSAGRAKKPLAQGAEDALGAARKPIRGFIYFDTFKCEGVNIGKTCAMNGVNFALLVKKSISPLMHARFADDITSEGCPRGFAVRKTVGLVSPGYAASMQTGKDARSLENWGAM